jgi:centromere protein J
MPPPVPKKHTFLKKNSRQVAPKPGVKRKPGEKKEPRDVSKGKEREDSHRASVNQSQEGDDEDSGKNYNLEHYLQDEKEPQEKVAVYDDKEPWDDPKSTKTKAAEGEDQSNKESAKKSTLLTNYFGSEKAKVVAEKKEQQMAAREEEAIAKKYVSEKVEDLDKEIKRLKTDREAIKAKERRLEDDRKKLAKEREEFEAYLKVEKGKLEEFKEEELKKMKKEKKIAERNQKAVMNMPNRKEREEIDALKDKLNKTSDEFSSKEKKFKLTIERQKKQIEELLKRNKELEEEIHLHEQMRLKGGVEEKGKAPVKIVNKKAPQEENYASGTQIGKKKGEDSTKEISKVDHKLKTKGSNLIEEKDDLLDFQKAEDEAIEEMHPSDHSDYRDEEERVKKPDLIDDEANKFQMQINPDEYAYSANKYYQEYIQAKNKSKYYLIKKNSPKWSARPRRTARWRRNTKTARWRWSSKTGRCARPSRTAT